MGHAVSSLNLEHEVARSSRARSGSLRRPSLLLSWMGRLCQALRIRMGLRKTLRMGIQRYWKREAEAEAAPAADAEAEPWYYSHWYGARAYSPYYYNRWGGYWKREADEEQPSSGPNADASPEADPEAYWYGAYGRRWGGWGYGYRPYGWGYGYRGYRW